jgi:hypothetical protein
MTADEPPIDSGATVANIQACAPATAAVPGRGGVGIEPPFDCDDDQCAPGVCSLADVVPVWMRPYRCQYLSDAERRVRRQVFGEPGTPIPDA